MTKKELIKALKNQEDTGDNDEILISIANEADPETMPSLVPIEYVGLKHISVTF